MFIPKQWVNICDFHKLLMPPRLLSTIHIFNKRMLLTSKEREKLHRKLMPICALNATKSLLKQSPLPQAYQAIWAMVISSRRNGPPWFDYIRKS